MTQNFDYNEFKNGKVAYLPIGKKARFVQELGDGTVIIEVEKFRGCGFNSTNHLFPNDIFRYTKEGKSKHGPNHFNYLYFK